MQRALAEVSSKAARERELARQAAAEDAGLQATIGEKVAASEAEEQATLHRLRCAPYNNFSEITEVQLETASAGALPEQSTKLDVVLSPDSKFRRECAEAAEAELGRFSFPRRLERALGSAGCRFVETSLREQGGIGGCNSADWEQALLEQMPFLLGEAAQRLESANANNERLESHNKQLLEEAHPTRIRELADEQMRELRRVGACCDAALGLPLDHELRGENIDLRAQVKVLQDTIRSYLPVPGVDEWTCSVCKDLKEC